MGCMGTKGLCSRLQDQPEQFEDLPEERGAAVGVEDIKLDTSVPHRNFASDYKINEEIGKGAFSTVHIVTQKKSNLKYAGKIVRKEGLSKEDEDALKLEVSILGDMNHPNIIRLYGFYEDEKSYYIVTELMQGGELFDRIVQKTFYTEKEARDLVFILLSAVKYMHDRQVVHRDLKPENLLLTSKKDDGAIKVADFGFAEHTKGMSALTTQCGTPGYVAPEILKAEPYGKAVDMWSVGVITYILLGGYPPFHDENQRRLFDKIKKGRYEFHAEYWGSVSHDAKDLISKMLKVNPLERLTADEALRHHWIMTAEEELARRDLGGTLREIRKFNARRKFRAISKALIAAARMQRMIGGFAAEQKTA